MCGWSELYSILLLNFFNLLSKAYLFVITDDVGISDLIHDLSTEMYKLIIYIVHATMRIECDTPLQHVEQIWQSRKHIQR